MKKCEKRVFRLLSFLIFSVTEASCTARAESKSEVAEVKSSRLYEIEIQSFERRVGLVVKGSSTLENLGERLGQAFTKVVDHAKAHGIELKSSPVARYLSFLEKEIVFEAGFFVDGQGEKGDRGNGVSEVVFETSTVAVTTHVGSQEESVKAYEALHTWIPEHGYKEAGAPWEEYLDDPESVPVAEQRTVIWYPVVKK